jgi:hypothetical protein
MFFEERIHGPETNQIPAYLLMRNITVREFYWGEKKTKSSASLRMTIPLKTWGIQHYGDTL